MDRDAPASERILVLAHKVKDAQLTHEFLTDAGFKAQICPTVGALAEALIDGHVGCVFLTEEVLTPAAWQTLSDALTRQPTWSDVPVILFASHPGIILERALERPRGNITVIETPVRVATVLTAARSSLRTRRRQYELRDLLDQQDELLRKLAEADRRKDEFLAMLGHELRNPLAAIHNALHVVRQAPAPHKIEANQQVIERQVRSLARIVDDLLDVSRVTLGKIDLERVEVDLCELARRCAAAFQHEARARSHDLEVTAPQGCIVVEGDPFRLEQILANLVTNALKYTPPGGRIIIAVEASGADAVLRVRDNGIGIALAVQPKIFELFMQARQGLERSAGGLGLGLSLVRSLVRLHDGEVSARSDGEGKGSEFVVRLPLLARTSTLPPLEESTPPVAQALRVAIIEDNEDARETLRSLVELMGHEVEDAADGLSGLNVVQRGRFDVALVDIGLPKIDGYEVARQVRGASQGSVPLLVAMTGYGQPEDRERALDAGFDLHMVKPVSVKDLGKMFARAGRKRGAAGKDGAGASGASGNDGAL